MSTVFFEYVRQCQEAQKLVIQKELEIQIRRAHRAKPPKKGWKVRKPFNVSHKTWREQLRTQRLLKFPTLLLEELKAKNLERFKKYQEYQEIRKAHPKRASKPWNYLEMVYQEKENLEPEELPRQAKSFQKKVKVGREEKSMKRRKRQ